MKNLIIKKIIPGILLIFGLFLLYHCQEEIISPNKNGSNVKIYVKGNKLNICKGDTVPTNASYAKFSFINTSGNGRDTLFSGVLNKEGVWDTTFNIELLGIPNVRVEGLLDLNKAVDSIFYICCDTSFVLNFLYDCNDVSNVDVSCDKLNDTINLILTNRVGGKILLGTPEADIAGNRFQLNTTENITVNVNEAKVLNGDFRAVVSPTSDLNGNIELGSGKPPLVIDFFVKTDKADEFTKTINLKTTCATGETGNITINLKSVITEDACACPFASNGSVDKPIDLKLNNVPLGTTSPDQLDVIISSNELSLGNGCYLVIDDVVRYNSSVPATDLEKAGVQVHEWKMAAQTFPIELRNGKTTFSMSTTFTPTQLGESVDTFDVHVSVHNSAGDLKAACSYLVSFSGTSCENNCPVLIINNTDEANLLPGNTKLNMGDTVRFNDGNILFQKSTGFINTACDAMSSVNYKTLNYKLVMDESDIQGMCNPLDIEITKSGSDAKYFDSWFNSTNNIRDNYQGFSGDPLSMGITFILPTIKEFIVDHPNTLYTCDFTIRVYTANLECTKTIRVNATAEQITSKVSQIHTIHTFSQVSDFKSEPALKAFSIPGIKNGNEIVTLDSLTDVETVNGNLIPVPDYSKEASFYFDVDFPNDITINGQMPELYLMSTDGNNFSNITQFPVASFPTSDDFVAGIEGLVKKVFDTEKSFSNGGHNFTYSNVTGPMWNNSLSKSHFDGNRNGVTLNTNDVFIIWNPRATQISNVPGVYGGYCEVAFIYITEISHGKEIPNADHLGKVSFIVAYPLSIVK